MDKHELSQVPALLLEKDLSLRVGTRDLHEGASDELIVEVAWSGICGSDLQVLKSGAWVEYWPATLGHEVAGTIVSEGHPIFPAGTRVVVDSRIACHACRSCQISPRLCENLTWLGESRPGGFAGRLAVPEAMLFRIPSSTPLEHAVLSEPLAVVLCALDQAMADERSRSPQDIMILGYGPIGALCAADAQRRWPNSSLTVVEPGQERAQYARDQGLTVLDPGDPITSPVDLLIEAAGYPMAMTDAMDRLAPGGTLLLVALGDSQVTISPATIVEHGWQIHGSIGFDDAHMEEAMSLLGDPMNLYAHVITHRLSLVEVPDFLADGIHSSSLKVIMTPNRGSSKPGVG